MSESTWSYNHRHSSELWNITAEILTELSRRDQVDYRVMATPESVRKKTNGIKGQCDCPPGTIFIDGECADL